METERYEALVDAILAIIITLIVMEIPLPETTTFMALWDLKLEFFAYALSFVVCFNLWNFHHNLFNIVHKLTSKITWTSALSLIVIGTLPYFTTFVANNFFSFTAQAFYGLNFVLTNINIYFIELTIMHSDKANIALHLIHEKAKRRTIICSIIFLIGYVIGYFVYPPAIIISCLFTLILGFVHK